MNNAERTYLLGLLKESEGELITTLQDVSEESFHSKPSDEQWSMSEIVEHLVMIDTGVLSSIQKHASKVQDAALENWENEHLVKIVTTRGRKVNAPDFFVPQGRFTTKAEAIAAYRTIRSKIDDFVTTTELPLEKIAFNHMTLGMLNVKNWIAFVAGHCKRHTQQIEELKTSC
ncbi:MAG: DinB family protein [Chitinophagales bacterium]